MILLFIPAIEDLSTYDNASLTNAYALKTSLKFTFGNA